MRRTMTGKNTKKASIAEILTTLTRSLAFQVDMIMWEDRKRGITDDQENLRLSYYSQLKKLTGCR